MQITIPDGISFADLRLAHAPNGDISFDLAVVRQIALASGLEPDFFAMTHEDAVSSLIAQWYVWHRQGGGESDPVADQLFAEVHAENAAGQPYSHIGGRA